MKRLLVAVLWRLLGRRNLVRMARFLLNEGRLDIPNKMTTNGELMIQDTVLRLADLAEPLVVFDVGANIGDWSRALLRCSGRRGAGLSLHAFEPSPRTFEVLQHQLEHAAATADLHLVRRGLSDVEREANLYEPHPLAGTSSVHPSPGSSGFSIESVALTTVDRYCRKHKIARIGLLKVDAEGHDLAVLEGAQSMLGAGAVDLIQFEYNHRWIFARRYLLDAFRLLQPLGYQLGKVTPRGVEFYERWEPELETFKEGNYLACRPQWRARFPAVAWWNATAGH